ncbi:MAG: alpha/beta fold hydrolase [Nitratireductor sp.]|nr:alpha/beta fold hydrolase [Nitratireductor sp.]
MILTSILLFPAISLAIAVGLVFSQAPGRTNSVTSEGKDGAMEFSSAVEADYSTLPGFSKWQTRAGDALPYRAYASAGETKRIFILLHGSGWHGMQFHPLARALADAGLGDVVVPDLRGHGFDPARRGDVDYVGQMEDDVADLIEHVQSRAQAEGQGKRQVVLLGHSSGGGLAVRFAGGKHCRMADGYVLLAPFLKYDAPTTRRNSGGWAMPAIRRIIGLSMLNSVGITGLNHLPVIAFNMPNSVLEGRFGSSATLSYSYRLNTSYSPRRDYRADLANIRQPLLVMAGEADEAFHADRYEAVIKPSVPQAEFLVLPGVTHLGIVSDAMTVKGIATWLGRTEL